jgi:SAM-dependent methyltransferase
MFLSRALRGFEITEDDVLVDYGCGKGRIVAQAARHYPFKKVIGLEISERLGAVASEEVEMNRDRFRAREVELVVDDAATWPLPDETTFIYLFHSFGEPVFSSVLDRINESLERRPRRLVLIYVRPLLHSRLLANGRFRLVKVSRGLRPDLESHRIHVYVVG